MLHLRARHVLGHPLGVLAPQRGHVVRDEVGVEPRVPELDGALLGHLQHRLAVGADAVQDDRPPRGRGVAVVARGDLEARREALDVPLPRPGQRLVEVVDVEDQPPLGRLEEAEVHEVGVAAQLGREPGVGRPGQVRRHEQRAAPVERAGRDEHAAVADGHQLLDPVGRLLLEQADRVRPAGGRLPARVRGAGRPLARRLAAGGALRRRGLAPLGDLRQQFDHDAPSLGLGGGLHGRPDWIPSIVMREPYESQTLRIPGPRVSRARAGAPASAA